MRNWTIKEAVEAINKNDTTAIKEISKHFPMFFLAIARNDLQALAAMMPEKFTVRRLVMVDAADETDAADTEETETDDGAADGDVDLSTMSTKELMKLCDKRGIKVPHYGKNKQFYLDALNGAGDAGESEEIKEAEDESNDPYEGKTAMELFKECKKRGIKAEPKQKAAAYIKLLKADDAKSDEPEEAEDDWGDEEEAEEKTTKKPAAKSTKSAGAKKSGTTKKAAAKDPEPAADDDDEWDI